MAEMATVESCGGALPEVVGVSAEGGATLGRDELRGPSREANRWAAVEAALNWMSKWLVSSSHVFAGLWKHDAEIMWILLGAAANYPLSLILKRTLNHERPASDLRCDPGMPSSHAQSICYGATLLVLSLYYNLGTNYLTMILGPATLSMATYLSWLRVSWRLHTLNQVMAGAAVGSAFAALWFVLWRSSGFITVGTDCCRPWISSVLCWLCALWKHDAEIMWVLLGAVANSVLSMVLKKMLNHERPSPTLRSDPGMPSSHAQSIFYAATILVLSLYHWIGTNYLTVILGPATLSMATYLEAFASSLLVRIAVILGSSAFCVGFVIYMIRHWLKDE
ncbi:Lipid phosphate phosphatase epsilon 2, chloroplastic [Dichanthelium oligosanthes]|uniref:Lipid phosphate phosphatase epsilon 2, chloroplastic n=1 Tax=Dichanthelium oligosanthes TaxID=888268 RepID=A0A1E5VWZ8_9POAL|nr:Lipid phosphate phosphatase epsilon 2, chloroplastic [Dichanthelium oligosanthes]